MASFFQPGSDDPAAEACPSATFQIYCNSFLPAERWLQERHQLASLIIAATTLAIPIVVGTIRLIHVLWQRSRRSSRQRHRNGSLQTARTSPAQIPAWLGRAKSFRKIRDDQSSLRNDSPEKDILIAPLSNLVARTPISNDRTPGCKAALLASLDVGHVSAREAEIQRLQAEKEIEGIVLECSEVTSLEQLESALHVLTPNVSSILLMSPLGAELLDSVNFNDFSGIIIQNACVLPDGERRDYYLAKRLRSIMGRCSLVRERRPGFFIGLYEIWETRPRPSVIRRAVKLSEHWGAVVEHGPAKPEIGSVSIPEAQRTLSGFDYLRRAECIQVQKTWMSEAVVTVVPSETDVSVTAQLKTRTLATVIPDAVSLFHNHEVNGDFERTSDLFTQLIPPSYRDSAPPRPSFWEFTSNCQPISSRGCFELHLEPLLEHHDAVLCTQKHLKDLGMLHRLSSIESQKVVDMLHRLPASAGHRDLVLSLIQGLTSHQVQIFRGLDTGFAVPDSEIRFWGVADQQKETTSTDIYISLKAPLEAAVILHTWLAEHDVPRLQAFEMEIELENGNRLRHDSGLTSSIRTAINTSSVSEKLFLVQQLQMSQDLHAFNDRIVRFCRSHLLDRVSREANNASQASCILDRSMSMRTLLEKRLNELEKSGATSLPLLDNLMVIFRRVSQLVEDGLFYGERDALNAMVEALTQVFDTSKSDGKTLQVNANADLFALILFGALRRAAFEDIYIEATDRCPLFLSQSDQAAVFAELWVLGSQCEIYFGVLPRELGEIIYKRYREFLQKRPPTTADRDNNEIMSMYSTSEVMGVPEQLDLETRLPAIASLRPRQVLQRMSKRITDFGANSIFCLPAIIDVLLLTFVGRGIFMTAFMAADHAQAAGYAVLTALLITAGVTGWVGSTGNFYLANYAYENMIYFHIQRLSGGFVLTTIVALGGLLGFGLRISIEAGLVYAAYLVIITTYLNLLGVMATMHQHQSPMTSGRTVLWRTIPLLFISPLLSSFVNGYDMPIYLSVSSFFLGCVLYQYRRLCHEWASWVQQIPNITEKNVLDWYDVKMQPLSSSDDEPSRNQNKLAQQSLRDAVALYEESGSFLSLDKSPDTFVASIARGMPYVKWLFNKTPQNASPPETFSSSWCTQLGEAVKQQQQLSRGLKEHSVFILFRNAKHDIGQNLGLFLVALMDRWVSVVMSAREPNRGIYTDARARYGICLCILYFCLSIMVLDLTLTKYWAFRFKLSTKKLDSLDRARAVTQEWERKRLSTLASAYGELFVKISAVLGITTVFLFFLVESLETTILYFLYVFGYTCVIIFQFNRCFTTNVSAHIFIILFSAVIGFVTGCILHALPWTAGWLYSDIVAQNLAAGLAAFGTLLYSYRDWQAAPESATIDSNPDVRRGVLARSAADAAVASEEEDQLLGARRCQKGVKRTITGVHPAKFRSLASKLASLFSSRNSQLTPDSPIDGTPAFVFYQKRIACQPDQASDTTVASLRTTGGTTFQSGDGTLLASGVTKALKAVTRLSSDTKDPAHATSIAVASMWSTSAISVKVLSRESFVRAGLGNTWSFSNQRQLWPKSDSHRSQPARIDITVGFLKRTECRDPAWHSLLVNLIAEAVLFHTARAALGLSTGRALLLEQLLQGPGRLSNRLEFEISMKDYAQAQKLCQGTNRQLMRHLCCDMAVDTTWDSMPLVGREAICNRAEGKPTLMSTDLARWMAHASSERGTNDACTDLALLIHRKCSEQLQNRAELDLIKDDQDSRPAELFPIKIDRKSLSSDRWKGLLKAATRLPPSLVKWVALISGGAADIERELWYRFRDSWFRNTILLVLLTVWRACWLIRNIWLHSLLIYHRPSLANLTRLARKGVRRKIVKNAIVAEFPRRTITGFVSPAADGLTRLEAFPGSLKSAPLNAKPLYTAIYSRKGQLLRRVDDNNVASDYHYASNRFSRWPKSKEVTHGEFRTVGFYDKYGRITHGTLSVGPMEYAFQYRYKATPKDSPDVLRADFKCIEPQIDGQLSVLWGVPVRDEGDGSDWVPSDRIHQMIKIINNRTYVTQAEYRHKRDPVLTTYLQEPNGLKTVVSRPPPLFTNEAVLLARPGNLNFDADDLLIYHNVSHIKHMQRGLRKGSSILSLLPSLWLPFWGHRVYRPVPTWFIRTELWNHWLKTGTLDAVTACWIDELILREEPVLKSYWKARNRGRLGRARRALDKDLDHIVAAIEIDADISEVCLLPIKISDLYSMGLGKDATQVTNRPGDCLDDTESRISVIFNDIGCWPEAPGGVSNCRRDLVNGHSTIRNHVLAECANDFGIPRFQVEKNVQSMKLLPLWGLDGKSAYHGLIDNILQSQVDDKIRSTDTKDDIIGLFVPLIQDFVKGARQRQYSRADLVKYSNVMLSMSKYYEHKDYGRTWSSPIVEKAWVEAWLIPYDDPNVLDPAQCFELEQPSLSDFREALGIFLAYFFIFSVKIPEKCPRVFQSTHHGISSLFGMVLKHRKGATFGIWDHAILWRECCLNISPAQCELPISVQSMLLSGIGLATRLAYFHADVVMPCTSLFNPMWEAEIGTDRGQLGSKATFARKIDPIVNGISDMESFTPVDKIRTEKPTVVMLSNVQFIKGVKTAILAADIIVNRFGFKDYQLLVYGAKDRQPSYALEMAKLIVDNNLSEVVILAGFGKPKEVLKDAWLFMNSSISEGLPLAIGEAALAGVPIVATEVGATALVLTDPHDQDQRYGEVVPPNDPLALARAQLSMLGMVGPWAKFVETADDGPDPILPDEIDSGVVEWLTRRMYDKTEDRRKLGLLSREVVLHSFHGNRYLREHEQMYWIQWHHAKMRSDETLSAISGNRYRFGAEQPLRYRDPEEDAPAEAGEDKWKWQDFETEVPSAASRPRKRLSKQNPRAVVYSPV